MTAGGLAVIAGRGALPAMLAREAMRQGHEVVVFTVAGQADDDFSEFQNMEVRLEAMGRARRMMTQAGCTKLVMVGKITRPSFKGLRPDAATAKLLLRAAGRGDDALLRAIGEFFAEGGITTLAPDVYMPHAVMPAGVAAGRLNAAAKADIECAMDVLRQLGGHDVGQGAIVQGGHVIAIEAAEGTDEMLRRSAGLVDAGGAPPVFAKRPKSGQDKRHDMPVIGENTLRIAARSGIGVIALEAGGVLLAGNAEALWKVAKELKLTVAGV